MLSNYFGLLFSLLAIYVDYITANPQVSHMVGFVLVLATLDKLNVVLIRVEISRYGAKKENLAVKLGLLKNIKFGFFNLAFVLV